MTCLTIAVSRLAGEPYRPYVPWLVGNGADVACVDLHGLSPARAAEAAAACDGLLLTGGEDVHPARYGRPDAAGSCYVDAERDEREWAAARHMLAEGKPVLGVCRGLQLLNVLLGGTLWTDLQTERPGSTTHGLWQPIDVWHPLDVDTCSALRRHGACGGLPVNSAHHQSADRIAPGLRVTARCPDGVVEALEGDGDGFILAVQWHPERMPAGEALRDAPVRAFLAACRGFRGRPTR